MKNITHIILSVCTLFFVISTQASPIPDPVDFSKKLVEAIRLNNKEQYIKTFAIQKADCDYLVTTLGKYPYQSPLEKEKVNGTFTSEAATFIKESNDDMTGSYEVIQDWIRSDSIDVSKIEYVETYYEIEYNRKAPFYVLDRVKIAIRQGEKYYIFKIRSVLYLNNKWVYGPVSSVNKVDKYLETIYDSNDATVVVDTTVVIADSVAAGDPYQEIVVQNSDAYIGLNPRQAKKIAKMQKQIDVLYLKMDKEYLKEY